MRDAKDYKNTIEFASKKYYKHYIKKKAGGLYPGWKNVEEKFKEEFRYCVITVLNAVNYFEGKTCSDCGYFDPVENVCFGEDREHKEQPGSPICETFAPKGLTEDK